MVHQVFCVGCSNLVAAPGRVYSPSRRPMFVTNHVLSGVVIGRLLEQRPVAAFFVGVGSHLALDMVPHWGCEFEDARRQGTLSSIRETGWFAGTARDGVCCGRGGPGVPERHDRGDGRGSSARRGQADDLLLRAQSIPEGSQTNSCSGPERISGGHPERDPVWIVVCDRGRGSRGELPAPRLVRVVAGDLPLGFESPLDRRRDRAPGSLQGHGGDAGRRDLPTRCFRRSQPQACSA